MDLRSYLRGALWAAGLLIVILLVAGILWLALGSAGDQAGSQGAKGVTLVAVVCLVLDFAVLIVLLTVAEITRLRPDERPSDHAPNDRPPTEIPRI